jgi:hypothetical protein
MDPQQQVMQQQTADPVPTYPFQQTSYNMVPLQQTTYVTSQYTINQTHKQTYQQRSQHTIYRTPSTSNIKSHNQNESEKTTNYT